MDEVFDGLFVELVCLVVVLFTVLFTGTSGDIDSFSSKFVVGHFIYIRHGIKRRGDGCLIKYGWIKKKV